MKNNITKSFTLGELAKSLGLKLSGDADVSISAISSLKLASADHISYISDKQYLEELRTTKAAAVILSPSFSDYCTKNKLISNNPALDAALCSQIFAVKTIGFIHPSAQISSTAKIDKSAYVGAFTVIESEVKVGANTHINSHCYIGKNCILGRDNFVDANVIIGSEGFGNVLDSNKHWQHISHFGAVEVGNNVYIGASSTIDRGRFGNTIIGDGARLDNLIHIAHNVCIGRHTAIAAGTKIAGSTTVGKHCSIGGMVGIENHLNIADNIVIYSGSIVRQHIQYAGQYSGSMPVMKHKTWLKVQTIIKKLDKIRVLFRKLTSTKK